MSHDMNFTLTWKILSAWNTYFHEYVQNTFSSQPSTPLFSHPFSHGWVTWPNFATAFSPCSAYTRAHSPAWPRAIRAMQWLEIAATQTSLQAKYSFYPERQRPSQHTAFLGVPKHGLLGQWLSWSMNFHLCPSLEACNTKWCPWDEELDSNKRVHFLIAKPALYHRMADFASCHNFDITLSTSNEPERNVTAYVELHLLSHVETVELLGRLYREFRTERLLSWRHMFWVDRFIHEHSMIRKYIRSWGSRKRSVITRVGSRPHCSGKKWKK